MMNWTADFPILAADENGNRLVYLDSAATTQHPMQVLNAVVDYYTKENANPHRGVYELVLEYGILSREELDEVLKPENMIRPVKLNIRPRR
jgi:selenocysteine lyase/cysteine desulfurase